MFSFLNLYNFSSPIYETKKLRPFKQDGVKYPSVPNKLAMTVCVR